MEAIRGPRVVRAVLVTRWEIGRNIWDRPVYRYRVKQASALELYPGDTLSQEQIDDMRNAGVSVCIQGGNRP